MRPDLFQKFLPFILPSNIHTSAWEYQRFLKLGAVTYLCADQTRMRNWNPLWSISLFTTRPGKKHLWGFQGGILHITANNSVVAVTHLLVRELNSLYVCTLLSWSLAWWERNTLFARDALKITSLEAQPSFWKTSSMSKTACEHLWEMLQLSQPRQQSAARRQTSLRGWMGPCWHTEHVQSCGAAWVPPASLCWSSGMCCAHRQPRRGHCTGRCVWGWLFTSCFQRLPASWFNCSMQSIKNQAVAVLVY